MGVGTSSSTLQPLTRENMIKLLDSPQEYQRLVVGFHRLLQYQKAQQLDTFDNKKGVLVASGIDKMTFRSKIMDAFPKIPKTLSDRLFGVMCQSSEELTENDFLTTFISIQYELRHNSPKNNLLHFIYTIYNIEELEYISPKIVKRFIEVIYGSKKLNEVTTKHQFQQLFTHPKTGIFNDKLTFDDFKQRVLHLGKPNIILDWLILLLENVALDPPSVLLSLEKKYDPDYSRQEIINQTQLSSKEVTILQKVFENVGLEHHATKSTFPSTAVSVMKMLSISEIYKLFKCQQVDSLITSKLVDQMMKTTTIPMYISFSEFCFIISMSCRGNQESQQRFLFMLFDRDNDSFLTKDDLQLMLQCIPKLEMEHLPNNQCQKIDETFHHLSFNHHIHHHALDFDSFSLLIKEHEILSKLIDGIQRYAFIEFGLLPLEKRDEARLVEEIWIQETKHIHESEIWYLIEKNWWKSWCGFSGFNIKNGTCSGNLYIPTFLNPNESLPSTSLNLDTFDKILRPGAISNWSLLRRSGSRRLMDNVRNGMHFIIVPSAVWKLLKKWYGGGPELPRKTVQHPLSSCILLEINVLVLRIAKLISLKKGVIVSGQEVFIGKYSTVSNIIKHACKLLLIKNFQSTRLWTFHETNPNEKTYLGRYQPNQQVFPREYLRIGNILLIECQDEDGSWILSEKISPSTKSNELLMNGLDKKNDNLLGQVGLDNLGNSCYLSCALQCLSHTTLLREYFLSGSYKYDLNLTNRDGLQGRLAVSFGELIHTLWTTSKSNISPHQFKQVISTYNIQFSGSDQHDAQELLSFLLSGLSEDLNRVVEKPYLEQADSAGRCDAIVAEEWWKNHLRREISVIVALFTGQYKSLLECNTCGYQSARFEPFTFLQLPIPETLTCELKLFFFFCGCEKPIAITIEINRDKKISDLKLNLLHILKQQDMYKKEIKMSDVLLAGVSDYCVINTIYTDEEKIIALKVDEQLVAFQLDSYFINESLKEDYKDSTSLSIKPLECGYAVHVVSQSQSETFAARIEKQNDNGTYDVIFANGKMGCNISRTRIISKLHQPILIYAIHRRIERQNIYFTNPFKTCLFGMPFIVRIVPGQTKGIHLYEMIWNRIHRLFRWKTPKCKANIKPFLPSKTIQRISNVLTLAQKNEWIENEFILRLVTRDGKGCSRCGWLVGCLGCLILPTEEFISITQGETIAIDWNISTILENYDVHEANQIHYQDQISCNHFNSNKRIPYEKCLELFTRREEIQEGYCGRCKSLRPSSKKMDLWRFPPILIIHLKRFYYSSIRRQKLYDFIEFPVHDLDLTSLICSQEEKINADLNIWRFLGGQLAHFHEKDNDDEKKIFSPRNVFIYDLYGVVNHMGALGQGHYVANVKCSDGKWKCFNDEKCHDIDECDVITSSAYILFYIRKDVQNLSIQDLFPRGTGKGITQTEIDAMLDNGYASRCNIM